MADKRLTRVLESANPAFGGWITTSSPRAIQAFTSSGYDYVGIDAQHGLLDETAASALLQPLVETETSAFVRVAANDNARIGKVLDAGADGVIVPLVHTPEQAAAAVAACRFAPNGVRSFGPMHPALGRDVAQLERRARLFVMIESREAVSNVEAICATPGVDGIYLGPSDLAVDYGLIPTAATQLPLDAKLFAVIERVCKAARAAGVVPGIHAGSGVLAAEWAAVGFRLLTCTSDALLLQNGATRELTAAAVNLRSQR